MTLARKSFLARCFIPTWVWRGGTSASTASRRSNMLLARWLLWSIERFRLWRIENHATVL